MLARTNVSSCESVNDTPASICFKRYYKTVSFTLKARRLAKKVRKWFCDGRLKNKDLEYRFTGKESLIMCHQFMTLLSALELEDDQPVHNFALHVFSTIAVNLRDSVSIFSRIKVTDKDVTSLTGVTRNLFRACARFSSVSPTTWTIGHCVAAHTKQIKQELGVGLGSTQWRAENLNMSLSPDLHETPTIQRVGYRYSVMNTSPLSGLWKMGVIWLNTHPPGISISFHDASLPHFVIVAIRNSEGRLNVLSAVIPYSRLLMIV